MAGHSKFKNIQFRKGAQDKKRSKLFSKLSRDITIAAKNGVPDPTSNARLRLAIANARAESMPKDNIDRAIKKALGGEADNYEDIRYEGFGPGGVGPGGGAAAAPRRTAGPPAPVPAGTPPRAKQPSAHAWLPPLLLCVAV